MIGRPLAKLALTIAADWRLHRFAGGRDAIRGEATFFMITSAAIDLFGFRRPISERKS
jgi:hypothetical protein